MLRSYDLGVVAARLARGAVEAGEGAPGRRAAVAAILREGAASSAEILLIRRAERVGDPWSGHMALPGGRRDAQDASLFGTAVREVREEVGIDLAAHGAPLTRLPDIQAVARSFRLDLVISPFVFALRADVELTLNHEVAEALWVPLGPLARGETRGTFDYAHEGRMLRLPCQRVGDRVVWGLTYEMLETLFEALHAG